MLSVERLLCGWILIQSAIIYGQCTSPKRCPQNENYVRCVNQCNTCVDRGVCRDGSKPHCVAGCDCITGHFRNSHGKCVPEHMCDGQQCERDEQYYVNKPDCKNTCERYNNPGIRCAAGKPGCFCKQGLVKRKDGKCVRPEDCFQGQCKRDEQYYLNKPDCKNTCENYDNPAVLCLIGKPGCFCKEGLVKRQDGKCVRPEECPRENCGANEEYQECGTACPDTCENYGKPRICTLQCVQGCFCKKGFVRGTDGQCILPKKCPARNCGANEEYQECGTACPDTCDNYGKPRICTLQCVQGCFCKKGFVRGINGQCILPKKCPARNCGPNEVYSNCVNPCNDCITRGNCQFLVCNKGCDCRPGFRRDKHQKCIPERQCPPGKCGQNEEYKTCGTACQPTCSKPNPPCTRQCAQGCFCKSGYIREEQDGKCIKKELCKKGDCGENEEYKNCGSACQPTCSNPNPFCTQQCVKGCFCKSGYIRAEKGGKCIKRASCNKGDCGENEEYKNCGTACQPTCSNPNPICTKQCAKGCFCKSGYIRSEKGGTCIKRTCCNKKRPCPLIKCAPGCRVIQKNCCPACDCSKPTERPCPQIRCREECPLDLSTKPCPTCKCPDEPGTNCPQYKCGPGCYLDSSIKPCPKCVCYQISSGEFEPSEDEDQIESSDDSIVEDSFFEQLDSFFEQLYDEAEDEETTEEKQESYEAGEVDESETDEDSEN